MSQQPILTVSVRMVWAFRAVSRALGVDSQDAWTAHGFTPEILDDPDTRVPVEVTQRLLEWAIAATGVSDFGLRAAELTEPGLFDLPEYAARSKATLRGALDCIIRLEPLLADATEFTCEVSGEAAIVGLRLPPALEQHGDNADFTFALLQRAARRFTGIADLAPWEVHFKHPAPEDTTHHERLFGAPVIFGASANRAVIPANQLDLPLVHADSRLSALFDRIAEGFLSQTAQHSTLSDRVRRLISRNVAEGAPVTEVARELGMTPRTLHRRLGEEGLTFQELADDVRKGLALAYLEQRGIAVSEIAYLLGFSGVQAFHRAFKRWTNETPGAYRQRLR